jgi:heavy metal sensor kinase
VTLTTRLSIFSLGLLGIVLVGFSTTLYLIADRYLHRQARDHLDAAMNTLVAAVEIKPHEVEWEEGQRKLGFDSSLFVSQVVWLVSDGQGHIVDRSEEREPEVIFADASSHASDSIANVKWTAKNWLCCRRWILPSAFTPNNTLPPSAPSRDGRNFSALSIAAGVPLTSIQATLRQLAISLLGLTLGIWLIALFAGRAVSRRALLPLSRMATAASEIDASDLAQRLPELNTQDELAHLNRAFNNLLDRLQEAFARQQNFTGDASHQLRTPLTAILGQIEVALRHERSNEEYQRVLNRVHKTASHLSGTVESLLFLSRADSEARLPNLERLDLKAWLAEHLRSWAEHSRANDLVLKCESDEACIVEVHAPLLGELVNILLDNACKYSEPGTPITVRVDQGVNAVAINIEDHGCGISEGDLESLFMPFFRSEESRRRGIEGVGLGLSIAKRLAKVFSGQLSVVSHVGQGSCFTLSLPSIDQTVASGPRSNR